MKPDNTYVNVGKKNMGIDLIDYLPRLGIQNYILNFLP